MNHQGDGNLNNTVYSRALELLHEDALQHLSTLKYLSIYRDRARVNLVEDSAHWATLVEFPTSILSYDTATYPKAKKAIFLNGTSEELKHKLLATLDTTCYLLRLCEELDLSVLSERFVTRPGHTFVSYTCPSLLDFSDTVGVPTLSEMTAQALDLFGRNGYTAEEMEKYFRSGARWFGLLIGKTLMSACFVYQNFASIWEIAGVHTLEAQRRHGYATTVVRSALRYLLGRGLIPRYEAEQSNTTSISLAKQLGMKEFLKIQHYLLEPR